MNTGPTVQDIRIYKIKRHDNCATGGELVIRALCGAIALTPPV